MFFLKEEERTITLHPSFFGPNIHRYLSDQLLHDIEGTYQGEYFVICVLDSHEFTEGKVMPGSAFAEYRVHYKAVVWKPFKGEVMDGVVNQISDNGFFVDVGPMNAFVARTMIPPEIRLDANATPPCWTDHADQVIEKGKHVRIKIKGIRTDLSGIYAIASINEDFLGTID